MYEFFPDGFFTALDHMESNGGQKSIEESPVDFIVERNEFGFPQISFGSFNSQLPYPPESQMSG
jgi:hypothetical protein